MDEAELDGTEVLERMTEIGRLDEFWAAVDADDIEEAVALMRAADLSRETIASVVAKLLAADGEH